MLGKVSLADYAHNSITIVDDRHTPDLMMLHHTHAIVKRIIDLTCKHLVGHAITDACPHRVNAVADDPDRDISVGHHADHAALPVYHRNRTAIALAHELRGIFDTVVGVNGRNIPRHQIGGARVSRVMAITSTTRIISTTIAATAIAVIVLPVSERVA